MNVRWLFLFLSCLLSISQANLQAKSHEKNSSKADYVVVGVGTAGGIVAKKLSDNRKTSVIALHSGVNLNNDPLIKYTEFSPITVGAGLFPEPPLYTGGETTPQTEANDRLLKWLLSLPLGGASTVNAGAYCRGTNEVYAQWEQIAGSMWSVDRITQIYKDLENYNGQTPNPEFRGYNGPLNIFQVPIVTNIALTFTNAVAAATDVPVIEDYNDPLTPIGVSPQMQYTAKGCSGEFRVSSGTAFLNSKVMTPDGHGVNGRKLRVRFNCTATRVIWKGTQAIGVEYLQGDKIQRVYAKKGVIVCAGLNSSPFLLQSGIGPADLLTSLSIPVVFDNPNVGQDLADQPGIRTIFTSNPLDTPLNPPYGLFSQIAWLPAPSGDPTVRALRFSTINPFPGVTLGLFDLNQPLSRGSVSINSNNPLSPPVVDLGVLTNPDDLNLLIQGFQIYMSGINQALQAIDPLYQLIYPNPAILTDTAALTDFIKENIASNQHFQSHCRMAPFNQGGVVDSNGAVYGVEGLYVADNSIAPLVMDGSPMASAYLIGANIADMLIQAQ